MIEDCSNRLAFASYKTLLGALLTLENRTTLTGYYLRHGIGVIADRITRVDGTETTSGDQVVTENGKE